MPSPFRWTTAALLSAGSCENSRMGRECWPPARNGWATRFRRPMIRRCGRSFTRHTIPSMAARRCCGSERIPNDFIPIGTIEPSDDEEQFPCSSYGDWGSITCQPLAQWRWDHDREKVLAEDLVEEQEELAQNAATTCNVSRSKNWPKKSSSRVGKNSSTPPRFASHERFCATRFDA